jgi:hypothetical protein
MRALRLTPVPRPWLVCALVALIAVIASIATHLMAGGPELGDEVTEAAQRSDPSSVLLVAAIAAVLCITAASVHRGRLGASMLVAAPLAVHVAGELAERVVGGAPHPAALWRG